MEKISKISVTASDIVGAAKKVRAVAKKHNWVFTLNNDLGTFYYSPHRISRNAQLFQLSDEMAIYLDKDTKELEGVMIEYYTDNFLEHHKEFKPLSEAIFNTDDEIQEVVPVEEEAYAMKVFFEKTISDEAGGLCLEAA